jgi:hypothetical protein
MLGVAWPEMRISFRQPISAAGLVPPLGVAATLISTTSSSHLADSRLRHPRSALRSSQR